MPILEGNEGIMRAFSPGNISWQQLVAELRQEAQRLLYSMPCTAVPCAALLSSTEHLLL